MREGEWADGHDADNSRLTQFFERAYNVLTTGYDAAGESCFLHYLRSQSRTQVLHLFEAHKQPLFRKRFIFAPVKEVVTPPD